MAAVDRIAYAVEQGSEGSRERGKVGEGGKSELPKVVLRGGRVTDNQAIRNLPRKRNALVDQRVSECADEGGGDPETGRSGSEWITAKIGLGPVLELAIAPGSGPGAWEAGGEIQHQTIVDSRRFLVLSNSSKSALGLRKTRLLE